MESGKYYVIAQGNNLYESMTKEEILAAITQAVESHTIGNVDTGFVTTLKEMNNNNGLKVWIGLTAEYNAIATKETNCLYILTDDTELEDIQTLVNSLNGKVNELAEKSISTINDYTATGGWSWHVRIYSNGFVEAWGTKAISNADVSTAEGSMYVVDGGFSVAYPPVLTESNGFTRKTASFGWDSAYYALPFGRLGLLGGDYVNIMRATSLTGVSGTLSIHMTGIVS